MRIPPSPHFTPVPLDRVFNAERTALPEALRAPADPDPGCGIQAFLGIPFALGGAGRPNVILLDRGEIAVDLGGAQATYLLVLHAVEDRPEGGLEGLADSLLQGNALGDHVSDYRLEYADGSTATKPVYRRFAIQQSRIGWGASAFAAVPAASPAVFPAATEEQALGRWSRQPWGRAETRHASGRDRAAEKLWIYAMPNPHPQRAIRRLVLAARTERSAVYGVSLTRLAEHPLRPLVRRKLRLALPAGAALNGLGELEGIAIDLGTVISARAALDYDASAWKPGAPQVQPVQSEREVLVEYAAHPAARLYVAAGADSAASYDLAALEEHAPTGIRVVAPALRPVTLRIVEKATGGAVPVRLHLHGRAGEYLPPRGHHRKVNPYWFEDHYAEHVNGANQYCYVSGECVADLPLGTVYVEATRGYEVAPLRSSFEVSSNTEVVTLELEKVLRWRERGWVTADTHVHFLSPQTALLEGSAEGVNVVNLLASQWGEMFSNVGDFDGATTISSRQMGGDGEFLVRVGTENRMQVLGHISLLGYAGRMIQPLCTGGPSESAIGDPLENTMSEWARRCLEQGGIVVLPHAPNPQLERAADIVLGLVSAVEMMSFNPLNPACPQVNPYGLADWYRYLNLGCQVPVVGGSDKMQASSLLGGIRTYALIGEDEEFTYESWMKAVRRGDTFVTVGPLASFAVEGVRPAAALALPAGGGTVEVDWSVESVSLPIERVEVVAGGLAVEEKAVGGLAASGTARVRVDRSTWLALRVRGSGRGRPGEIAAHTSAVQVTVGGEPPFSPKDAGLVLDQIQGAIAYVDTLAPRPEAKRYRMLRAELESAYNRLHQRMHRAGFFHRHAPLHDHAEHHEH